MRDNVMFGYYSKLSSEVYDLDKYIGCSFEDIEFYLNGLSSCKGSIFKPGVCAG